MFYVINLLLQLIFQLRQLYNGILVYHLSVHTDMQNVHCHNTKTLLQSLLEDMSHRSQFFPEHLEPALIILLSISS